jgi:putative ABC transport system substrate-binding protein
VWQAFVAGLGERGYIQGQNLVLECRWTEGREERASALAAELVRRKVDLIVANGTNQVRAAKQTTSTIPIVMRSVIDPVGRGLVDNLARPGGNVTGPADDAGLDILGKYLALLTEAVPKTSRVAVLRYVSASREPVTAPAWWSILETEAQALGVTLQPYRVEAPEELAGAFTAMTKARAEALLVVPSTFFAGHRQRIVALAAQSRLPAMYPDSQDVEAGGLMAYAVDELEIVRRVGAYIDRILKGAKPGELPVEQPTRFKLILNLKTARALGLTIPRGLLIQADEVIR